MLQYLSPCINSTVSKCSLAFLVSPQSEIDCEVAVLLALKARYRELTGEDPSGGAGKKKGKGKSEGKQQPNQTQGKMEKEKKPAPAGGEGRGHGSSDTRQSNHG